MSAFKDLVKKEIHTVFLNTDEFSDTHEVNGAKMPVQVDEIEQIEREKRFNQNMGGIYTQQKLIYVAASDYGALPKQGSIVTFDGQAYRVEDAIDEGGVYSITLGANRS